MRSPSKNASPPPSSTIARCDSGARSPRAPTEPSCGTTGTMPALSIAASACSVSHADARMAAHQRVDADAQHRAHDVGRERLADAHGMGDDQVVLQFVEQRSAGRAALGRASRMRMRAEQLVGIAAEAGGDAVDRLLAAHLLGEEFGGARDRRELRRRRARPSRRARPRPAARASANGRRGGSASSCDSPAPASRAAARARPAAPARAPRRLRTARRGAGP